MRGRPLVWAISVGADQEITAGQPSGLPGTPPPGADASAMVTVVAGRPVVLTGAGAPGLQLGCADGWRALAPPPGTATVLQAAASGLYSITADGLQRVDPPQC